MNLGGDPQDIRDAAHRVRVWADAVDDDAATVLRARQVQWHSTAAEGFRDRLEAKARETAAVATAMRHAADTLEELARTLEHRQRELSHLLDEAGKTIEDVEELVRRGATDVLDGARSWAHDAAALAKKGKGILDSATHGVL